MIEREDKLYSRYLRAHISLAIISTPTPAQKAGINLLLLKEGQDIRKLRVKEILDSLFSNQFIGPVLVVGIQPFDRMQNYGVAGIPGFKGNGIKADKYSNFIDKELYSFINKKAGVRKHGGCIFRIILVARQRC